MIIRPAKNMLGAIRLPGDKSISHRYAMLGGIAEGITRLSNFSSGADCASTLSCLQQLGCVVKRTDPALVEIHGRDLFQQPSSSLDCGNSGSTMRMMAGLLAGQPIACDLHGDESLSRRPMARVMTPLRLMGAEISAAAGEQASVAYPGIKIERDRICFSHRQRASEISRAVCRTLCRRARRPSKNHIAPAITRNRPCGHSVWN